MDQEPQQKPHKTETSKGSGLEKLTQKQQQRSDQLYRPLQHDLKTRNEHPGIRHHLAPNSSMNRRNKHNKLNEVRQRHKMQSMETKREKVHEKQCDNDTKQMLEQEAAEVMAGVDIDQLIFEERDILSQGPDMSPEDAELQQMLEYEQELESYFDQLTIGQ